MNLLKEIKKMPNVLEEKRHRIAAIRDSIQTTIAGLEELAESCENAENELAAAVTNVQAAVDKLSKLE